MTTLEPTLDPTNEQLQSYLDGELSAEARATLESALGSDESLRARLDSLVALRALLAEAPSAFEGPDPGDLAFERVRRSIHDSIAPAHAAEPAQEQARTRSGTATPTNLRKLSSGARSRRMFFGAVVSVAAAAAVFFVSFGLPSGNERNDGVASTTGSTATSPVQRVAARLNGTEIVRVEFGKMSGTYWEQNEGVERVAVVWIDDTFPGEVGRP